MPDLSQRSDALELLDGEVSREDLWLNLKELDTINRWLGGHKATLMGLERLTGPQRPWRIVDIGCGGGDSLKAVSDWAQKNQIRVELTGVDLKPECLEYAQAFYPELQANWVCSDYRKLEGPWDIVISSLFCHHLTPEQFLEYLTWTKRVATWGFVINDLHRHPLAYHGIQALTGLLSNSHLVKHDAALSVWRGFHRHELKNSLKEADLMARVEWIWAFRYLVVGYV